VLPLADLHVHLLAGLDDGPRTMDDALTMCRMAVDQGVAHSVALAHQNDAYPDVTPARIREATALLVTALKENSIPLNVYPTAEVMVHPDVLPDWNDGKFLTVADRGQWLLIEFPHNFYTDLRSIIQELRSAGVRAILAHPERTPELLYEPGAIEELINLGCLVQVSTGSLTSPNSAREQKALKDWVKRGIVHLVGTDGHSVRRRPPLIAEAAKLVTRWASASLAEMILSSNGLAVLRGQPVPIVSPARPTRSWFARLWS